MHEFSLRPGTKDSFQLSPRSVVWNHIFDSVFMGISDENKNIQYITKIRFTRLIISLEQLEELKPTEDFNLWNAFEEGMKLAEENRKKD